ncbi:hypothetical protein MN608_09483 [Microdochium nivale]|nr:hypothetical protein MN608_09483 [Microdochium nivale]
MKNLAGQAPRVSSQGERDDMAFRQAAELARMSKELQLDEKAAAEQYDKNHDLIMHLLATDPGLYIQLLTIINDNKVLRREKAQRCHEDKVAQWMQYHKQESELIEQDSPDVEPKESTTPPPGSMPSPVSAVSVVPPATSRCNSLSLDSIEVIESISPAPLPDILDDDVSSRQDDTDTAILQPPRKDASSAAASTTASTKTLNPAGERSHSTGTETNEQAGETQENAGPNKRPASSEVQQQPPAKRLKGKTTTQARTETAGSQDGQPGQKRKKTSSIGAASSSTPLTDRTITFNEVSSNRIHHDTIVEYPIGSDIYYIVYCKEHGLHFKNKSPIAGAAKHLASASHGEMKKDWDLALKTLGYHVTGCTMQLKTEHNEKVGQMIESGYVPQGMLSKRTSATKVARTKPPVPPAAKAATHSTPKKPARPAFENGKKDTGAASPGTLFKGVSQPKTFHVYQTKWATGNGAVHYPVMILGWDSQGDSGLGGTLYDTKLLNGEKPACYQYDKEDKKIIGWETDYEDGGSKVTSRKFPVLFFDGENSVAWILARSLKKYDLYEDARDPKERKKQNEVRRWIARREGFTSWKKRQIAQPGATFEEARRKLPKDDSRPQTPYSRSPSVATPPEDPACLNSSLTSNADDSDDDGEAMDMDDSDSSLECETSQDAELQKLLQTAGEIPGDKDYTDSQETADLDVEMPDAYSPSKAYRKAFISTRSTNTTKPSAAAPSTSPSLARLDGQNDGTSQPEALSHETLPPTAVTKDRASILDTSCLKKQNEALHQTPGLGSSNKPNEPGSNATPSKTTATSEPAEPAEPAKPAKQANQAEQVEQGEAKQKANSPIHTQENSMPRVIATNVTELEPSIASTQATLDNAKPISISTNPDQLRSATDTAQDIRTANTTATGAQDAPSVVVPANTKASGIAAPPPAGTLPKSAAYFNDSILRRLAADAARKPLSAGTQGSGRNTQPPLQPASNGASVSPMPTVSHPAAATTTGKPWEKPAQAPRNSAEHVRVPEPRSMSETPARLSTAAPAERTSAPRASAPPAPVPTWDSNAASLSSTGPGIVKPERAASFPQALTSPMPIPALESMSRESSFVASTTASPVAHAKSLPGVEFTVQLYSRGPVHWEKAAVDTPSIKATTENGVLRSVGGSAVEVEVRPGAVQTFIRQRYGPDNYKMVLVPVEKNEDAVHIVFGPGRGCRGESGKTQSRRFVQWMQTVNPSLTASED